VTISGDPERKDETKDAGHGAPAEATPSGVSAALEIPAAAVAPMLSSPVAPEDQSKADPTAPPAPPPRPEAGKGKAREKSKASVVPARAPEPVAGLPRVVPSDYARQSEDAQTEAAARPGAPTPISPPQQNFAR
jgi:hypothetical protein